MVDMLDEEGVEDYLDCVYGDGLEHFELLLCEGEDGLMFWAASVGFGRKKRFSAYAETPSHALARLRVAFEGVAIG